MDTLHSYRLFDTSFTKRQPTASVAALSGEFQPNFIHLVEMLQTSLEITELLQLFADEAAKYLPVTGVLFQNQDDAYKNSDFVASPFQYLSELTLDGDSLGYVSYYSQQMLDSNDQHILELMQQKLVFPIRNALSVALLQKQALKDHLTGLANRGSFEEELARSAAKCEREQTELTLLLLDLDNFKQANDTFGHAEGDRVLIEFAKIINDTIRQTDKSFRFGGDEFAILLEGASQFVAHRIASQINDTVRNNAIMQKTNVSTSIGIASKEAQEHTKHFFERADKALYAAKNAGRDCLKTA